MTRQQGEHGAQQAGRGPQALVIGLGNPYRHDDGAGLAVAARVRAAGLPGVVVRELETEPVALIDAWDAATLVYLADAVSSGGEPGTVYRFDAASGALPAGPLRNRGTHAFSLADAVELGRALGRLPARLIIYGVEGAEFGAGTGLSPRVAEAAGAVVTRLIAELTSAGLPNLGRAGKVHRDDDGGERDRF
jgi:hydrogenase maturation protease